MSLSANSSDQAVINQSRPSGKAVESAPGISTLPATSVGRATRSAVHKSTAPVIAPHPGTNGNGKGIPVPNGSPTIRPPPKFTATSPHPTLRPSVISTPSAAAVVVSLRSPPTSGRPTTRSSGPQLVATDGAPTRAARSTRSSAPSQGAELSADEPHIGSPLSPVGLATKRVTRAAAGASPALQPSAPTTPLLPASATRAPLGGATTPDEPAAPIVSAVGSNGNADDETTPPQRDDGGPDAAAAGGAVVQEDGAAPMESERSGAEAGAATATEGQRSGGKADKRTGSATEGAATAASAVDASDSLDMVLFDTTAEPTAANADAGGGAVQPPVPPQPITEWTDMGDGLRLPTALVEAALEAARTHLAEAERRRATMQLSAAPTAIRERERRSRRRAEEAALVRGSGKGTRTPGPSAACVVLRFTMLRPVASRLPLCARPWRWTLSLPRKHRPTQRSSSCCVPSTRSSA